MSRVDPTIRMAVALLADALRARGRHVVICDRRYEDIAWLDDGGGLHVATARHYDRDAGAVRYRIDCDVTRITDRAWAELGLPRRRWSSRYFAARGSRCEQTCHAMELGAVAPWLAAWTIAREADPTAAAPSVPPVSWTWSHQPPAWTYGWSVRAWDAVDEHRRARAALRTRRSGWAAA